MTSAELFGRCWRQAKLSPAYEQAPWEALMLALMRLPQEDIPALDSIALLGATLPQLRSQTEQAVYRATWIFTQLEQLGRLQDRGEVLRLALASEAGTVLDEQWRGQR